MQFLSNQLVMENGDYPDTGKFSISELEGKVAGVPDKPECSRQGWPYMRGTPALRRPQDAGHSEIATCADSRHVSRKRTTNHTLNTTLWSGLPTEVPTVLKTRLHPAQTATGECMS